MTETTYSRHYTALRRPSSGSTGLIERLLVPRRVLCCMKLSPYLVPPGGREEDTHEVHKAKPPAQAHLPDSIEESQRDLRKLGLHRRIDHHCVDHHRPDRRRTGLLDHMRCFEHHPYRRRRRQERSMG